MKANTLLVVIIVSCMGYWLYNNKLERQAAFAKEMQAPKVEGNLYDVQKKMETVQAAIPPPAPFAKSMDTTDKTVTLICPNNICKSDFAPKRGEARARAMFMALDEDLRKLPEITWILDGGCKDGSGMLDLGRADGCKSGTWAEDLNHAWIVTNSFEADWTTILAHEFVHIHLAHTIGDADADHRKIKLWEKYMKQAMNAVKDD